MRKDCLLTILVALAAVLCDGSGRRAQAAPWTGRVTYEAGDESDLTLDPGREAERVDGGPFAGVLAQIDTRWAPPGTGRLDLGTRLWYERFLEADRRLLSGTAALDWLVAVAPGVGLRFGGGGHFYDDDARRWARRLTAWGDAGLVLRTGCWRAELQGGYEGRRHPRLRSPDDAGVLDVYTETARTGGALVELRFAREGLVRAAWHVRRTESRDPAYDADDTTLSLGLELPLDRRTRLLLDGFVQDREFTSRTGGGDTDDYRQIGVGLSRTLAPDWRLQATWTRSRYEWPSGETVDTHRLRFAAVRRFGGPAPPRLPPPARLPARSDVARAGCPLAFRLHAPDAQRVSLVADFNAWRPDATPLAPVGDGWWEVELELPPGTHAYAFLVDGAWVEPPEAVETEADGFGGRNGLVTVLP